MEFYLFRRGTYDEKSLYSLSRILLSHFEGIRRMNAAFMKPCSSNLQSETM